MRRRSELEAKAMRGVAAISMVIASLALSTLAVVLAMLARGYAV